MAASICLVHEDDAVLNTTEHLRGAIPKYDFSIDNINFTWGVEFVSRFQSTSAFITIWT